MTKEKKSKTLPLLTPIPDGLTQHPYTLLATISSQMASLEQHFSPEAYTYIREAIFKILTGTDAKIALRLDFKRTDENRNLRNVCMVYDIIERNAKGATLQAIYTDISANGYEWCGKNYGLGYDNIKSIYEKLSPIIFHNQKIAEVNLKD